MLAMAFKKVKCNPHYALSSVMAEEFFLFNIYQNVVILCESVI